MDALTQLRNFAGYVQANIPAIQAGLTNFTSASVRTSALTAAKNIVSTVSSTDNQAAVSGVASQYGQSVGDGFQAYLNTISDAANKLYTAISIGAPDSSNALGQLTTVAQQIVMSTATLPAQKAAQAAGAQMSADLAAAAQAQAQAQALADTQAQLAQAQAQAQQAQAQAQQAQAQAQQAAQAQAAAKAQADQAAAAQAQAQSSMTFWEFGAVAAIVVAGFLAWRKR